MLKRWTRRLAVLLHLFLLLVSHDHGVYCFVVSPTIALSSESKSMASRASSVVSEDVAATCATIDKIIAGGMDPRGVIAKLDEMNTAQAPNRQASFFGEWHVWYTDCPPPSNGQLGPFKGTAEQVVRGPPSRSYQNILKVPPSNWLGATLDGTWQDWDGNFLDGSGNDGTNVDLLGDSHWKVTFLELRIQLFGLVVFRKSFDAETSRIWRTTYLDDQVRVVRASKSGRVDDEFVFYTKRSPR